MSETNTYKFLPSGPMSPNPCAVLHLETGNIIPLDPSNRHYQEYQVWLAAGNVTLPADASPNDACAISPAPTEGTV